MNKLIDALVKLLSVKSIMTLVCTFVFAYLSVRLVIGEDLFMTVFIAIVSFYFGTQHERAKTEIAAPAAEKEEAAEK